MIRPRKKVLMNKVIMMGCLTRDPEMRVYGNDGKALASFSIAVDRRFKRDGQPTADFFNCTAFGATASFVEKYLKKGTKVVIDGELQNNNYEDNTGTMHYVNQIMINSIEFAESKKASEQNRKKASQNNDTQSQADPNLEGFMDVTDDEADALPFD